jgi:16S rRNA C967 or C1407 C5-methylase (RsmB/RsmF family)
MAGSGGKTSSLVQAFSNRTDKIVIDKNRKNLFIG